MMGDRFYDRLGVSPDATDAEVRQAWLRLARTHHPDAHADPAARAAAEVEMRAINEAWAVLGDPARRAAYDAARRSDTTRPSAVRRRSPSTSTGAPTSNVPAPSTRSSLTGRGTCAPRESTRATSSCPV